MVYFKTVSWTNGNGFKMEYRPTGNKSIQNNTEYFGDYYRELW